MLSPSEIISLKLLHSGISEQVICKYERKLLLRSIVFFLSSIECIQNLLPDNNASLVDTLPTLATGECLVVGDAVPLPAVVKMDLPDPMPNSSNVNVFDEWNKDWIDIVFDDVIRRWRKE